MYVYSSEVEIWRVILVLYHRIQNSENRIQELTELLHTQSTPTLEEELHSEIEYLSNLRGELHSNLTLMEDPVLEGNMYVGRVIDRDRVEYLARWRNNNGSYDIDSPVSVDKVRSLCEIFK
ncbi:hypothetical protein LIS04_214 [Listeria phage LIS04]|nr:hypothetical protein LIS04_214 [Listeria phage LIS04]